MVVVVCEVDEAGGEVVVVVIVVSPAIGSSPEPPTDAMSTATKTRRVIPARTRTIRFWCGVHLQL